MDLVAPGGIRLDGGRGLALHGTRAFHLIAREKLPGQFEVGLGATGAGIIEGYGLAVTGRLGQPDVAWNYGAIEPFAEILAEGFCDLLGQVGAVVVHRSEEHTS